MDSYSHEITNNKQQALIMWAWLILFGLKPFECWEMIANAKIFMVLKTNAARQGEMQQALIGP